MGHNASGDNLNIARRCLLIGLEQAVKIMDDILLAACSIKEAYLMGARLLANAAKKHWIFSKKKFSIGPTVNYCGLTLTASPEGKVTVMPSIDKVEALFSLPTPSNKKEAQRLVGTVLVMAKWAPGLSPALSPITQLTGTGRFFWGPDQEASLCKVRQLVRKLSYFA